MAKEERDERLEMKWVTFIADARVDPQSSGGRALVKSDTTRLFLGWIGGLPFCIVEDKALPHPGTIPMSNVASVGWVVPPTSTAKAP